MRYSTIAGAALLTPAVFASPLNARQAGVPTCNPNNIRALGQQKPKSTGFCTNWFKTTTTKHVAPVTVTGLSEAQITNLCSCILAPTYVSGRPLTSLEPTSTQGSTTAAQTSSTTPAITSSVASSTTTSSSASATPTGCVNGDTAAAADGAIYTKYCDSALDGGIGQSFSVGSLANCQAKCTDSTCKGFVYTAASRSCLLYTSVDGPYDNAGSTALVYKSGRGSTSSSSTTTSGASSSTSASSSLSSSASSSSAVSSSTTSTSATTTSGPASAPSVFNIYIATAASATTSGTIVRQSDPARVVGVYASPTPVIARRGEVVKRQSTCAEGNYLTNGITFEKKCGQTFVVGANAGVALDNGEQPGTSDSITSLTQCIDFCAKKGPVSATNSKPKCKAVNWDPTVNDGTGCKLYSSVSLTTTTGTTTNAGKSSAYVVSQVPAPAFTIDSRTGYIYANDTTGNALCGAPSNVAEDTTTNPTTPAVAVGDVFNGKIAAASCIPLVCSIDSQLRLTCSFNSGNIVYGRPALIDVAATSTTAAYKTLRLNAGSPLGVSLYVAAAGASDGSTTVISNGAEKALAATTDFVNTRNTTSPATKAFANIDANGAINMTYALDAATANGPPATSNTGTVTLLKDVFVYANDYWRFTASVNLEKGRFTKGISCSAKFGFDTVYASTITIDSTYPSSYDLLFEGQFAVTKTSTASIVITCNTDTAITLPLTVSNIKLVNNPSAPARANYYTVGSATSATRKAYIQFYNGTGTLIPDGQKYNGVDSVALSTGPANNNVIPTNAGTTSVLYVGQSLANKGDAIRDCAAKDTAMFELYFDTTDSFWKCVTFGTSLPSATLFTSARFPVTAANANPVFGYYKSIILPFVAN